MVDFACSEAETYVKAGGMDALIVENMNDLPYCKVRGEVNIPLQTLFD